MPIRRTAFASGLRVVSERMPGSRSAAIGFFVRTGSRDEPPQLSGSSHFLEHLLFKGTRTRTARDIAETFDAIGGSLNAYTAKESTVFHARVLDRDLAVAVEHLSDMLRNSTLRRPDMEAERQVILEEINMYEDAPDDIVHDRFQETLWPDHPLGRPILGTKEAILGATREQVHRFYRKHYVPGNLVVAAAGNVDHDLLVRLLRRHLDAGRVTGGVPVARERATGTPPAPSGTSRIFRRKTEQAHLVLGTNAPTRSDPDRFAFGIANSALGGGMSSRLFQEVRERRGLAYSVYSHHEMYGDAGLVSAYAGTTPARAQEVVDLIRTEIAVLAAGRLGAEEFDRAKTQTRGQILLSLEHPSSRMSRLGRGEISGGEILTVPQILRRIERTTLDDAREAAARVFSQPLTLAVLGPFAKGAIA